MHETVKYLIIKDMLDIFSYFGISATNIKKIGLQLGIKNLSVMKKNDVVLRIIEALRETKSADRILQFYETNKDLFMFSEKEAEQYLGEVYQVEEFKIDNKYHRDIIYLYALADIPTNVIELQALAIKNEFYYNSLFDRYN